MIRAALRRVAKILASARFATLLLALIGLWSMLASVIPQGVASDARVLSWASSNPLAESVVRVLGLHQAFEAPMFALCGFALAVSTALCAWRRTRAALSRSRILRAAASADAHALAADHDLDISCDRALGNAQALSIAATTLQELGVAMKPRGALVAHASPAWVVWGSPVFHWALLALIVAMPLGGLFRASGQMGVAVGQTKADEPASYGWVAVGPLHTWPGAQRRIRVDSFDVSFKSDGVNRGPTPTVSVLDERGAVVATQRVYPNMTLKSGSLTVYPADYGLSATVSILDTAGAETRRSAELLDFSGKAEGGTVAVEPLVLDSGDATLIVRISVPLDEARGGLLAKVPAVPRARLVATTLAGETLLDRTLRPGEQVPLPSGGAVRLIEVGYYARLQLVDDPSMPVLYAAVILALAGLGVAALARQQVVLVTAVEDKARTRLLVRVRLWRNASSSRDEIETELARALGGTDEGRPA